MKVRQFDSGKRYTYADYLTWDNDTRWELIGGVPHMMAGAGRSHQRVSMNFSVLLGSFLKSKTCEVYTAPFDVRLNFDTKDDTVVQPDIMVVCDMSKLDERASKALPTLLLR